MLEKYTQTPKEILELMDEKSSVLNMIEKYFSISYPDKKIFTKDRDAYPLKLNATDIAANNLK